jgi:hypothetical protein
MFSTPPPILGLGMGEDAFWETHEASWPEAQRYCTSYLCYINEKNMESLPTHESKCLGWEGGVGRKFLLEPPLSIELWANLQNVQLDQNIEDRDKLEAYGQWAVFGQIRVLSAILGFYILPSWCGKFGHP